jgi:hypothetical protein
MENNGRYQAITLGKEALILDTQEGHLWLWGVVISHIILNDFP